MKQVNLCKLSCKTDRQEMAATQSLLTAMANFQEVNEYRWTTTWVQAKPFLSLQLSFKRIWCKAAIAFLMVAVSNSGAKRKMH